METLTPDRNNVSGTCELWRLFPEIALQNALFIQQLITHSLVALSVYYW